MHFLFCARTRPMRQVPKGKFLCESRGSLLQHLPGRSRKRLCGTSLCTTNASPNIFSRATSLPYMFQGLIARGEGRSWRSKRSRRNDEFSALSGKSTAGLWREMMHPGSYGRLSQHTMTYPSSYIGSCISRGPEGSPWQTRSWSPQVSDSSSTSCSAIDSRSSVSVYSVRTSHRDPTQFTLMISA
jgi:hypothetical protein